MRLFLIRHAQAGDRTVGHRDIYRPLSPKGHKRARSISELLGSSGITKVLSSPATRCVQTVEPLAERLGLTIDEHPDLWEGTPTPHVLALLTDQAEPAVAVCSHGDIIPDVIEVVASSGADVTGRGCEKGSVWVVDVESSVWLRARYLDRSSERLPEEQP